MRAALEEARAAWQRAQPAPSGQLPPSAMPGLPPGFPLRPPGLPAMMPPPGEAQPQSGRAAGDGGAAASAALPDPGANRDAPGGRAMDEASWPQPFWSGGASAVLRWLPSDEALGPVEFQAELVSPTGGRTPSYSVTIIDFNALDIK